MIADTEIRGAEPTAVIEQYEPFIQKLASRYYPALRKTGAVGIDDLIQVGRIAILDAQQKYDPDSGSFLNYLSYCIRSAMRRTLGFNNNTGAPPVALVYLDEPLSEDSDTTRGDLVADPDAVPLDEPIIEDETRQESKRQIQEALERMKSEKQRRAITLVWMEGKSRKDAAEAMQIPVGTFHTLEQTAKANLRRDWRLKRFIKNEIPIFQVGVNEFNCTWTSGVEKSVIWMEDHGYIRSNKNAQK